MNMRDHMKSYTDITKAKKGHFKITDPILFYTSHKIHNSRDHVIMYILRIHCRTHNLTTKKRWKTHKTIDN